MAMEDDSAQDSDSRYYSDHKPRHGPAWQFFIGREHVMDYTNQDAGLAAGREYGQQVEACNVLFIVSDGQQEDAAEEVNYQVTRKPWMLFVDATQEDDEQ